MKKYPARENSSLHEIADCLMCCLLITKREPIHEVKQVIQSLFSLHVMQNRSQTTVQRFRLSPIPASSSGSTPIPAEHGRHIQPVGSISLVIIFFTRRGLVSSKHLTETFLATCMVSWQQLQYRSMWASLSAATCVYD